ncbi:MAG: hypothetical protein K6F75_11710 [Butyrivibrio sp.]|nr:hypothetical protein [Butyrivibrio sp.]
MEKRFRDYLKHYEKLDYDVLSDEEIADEKSNLELKTGFLHREMMRLLVIAMGLFVCACIFLSTALSGNGVIVYVLAGIMALLACYVTLQYRGIGTVIKQLEVYIDKLTML